MLSILKSRESRFTFKGNPQCLRHEKCPWGFPPPSLRRATFVSDASHRQEDVSPLQAAVAIC